MATNINLPVEEEAVVDTTVMSRSREAVVSRADAAVGAAFMAAGMGGVIFGLMVVGAEASTEIKNFLNWVPASGPLSGKVGIGVLGFVLSWVIMHAVFKTRPLKLSTSFGVSLLLIALSLMLTYPPFFYLFGHH